MLPKDSTVIVYISLGREIKEVDCPYLVGLTQAKAEKKLKDLNLEVGEVTYAYNDAFDAGLVIEQSVKEGDKIVAGQKLVAGLVHPKELIRVGSTEEVEQYIVKEVEKVKFEPLDNL